MSTYQTELALDDSDVPAVDGPFVEVEPGKWLRAAAVIAVEDFTDYDYCELQRYAPGDVKRREYVARLVVEDKPEWYGTWRSPYTTEQLRTACRLAEHKEDFRRLEAVARLSAVYNRRGG